MEATRDVVVVRREEKYDVMAGKFCRAEAGGSYLRDERL